MKIRRSSSGVVFDFFALTVLFSAVLLSVLFAKHLLFSENGDPRELTFITEAIPSELEGRIAVGDTLYDTLTKRKLGEIKSLDRIYESDKVKFILKTDASFTPSSEALRTDSLWFRVKLGGEAVK